MADAFTGNVKLGGLNSSSQIRILLCYLIKVTASPLSKSEIETAVLSEELVNYFELEDALGDLETQKLATITDGRYVLTAKGDEIARTLKSDLPTSVSECAVRAAIEAQQFARKESQHKASIETLESGYMVHCYIEDLHSKIFDFSLYMPDLDTAKAAKLKFINNGDDIYRLMLAGLTGNKSFVSELLK